MSADIAALQAKEEEVMNEIAVCESVLQDFAEHVAEFGPLRQCVHHMGLAMTHVFVMAGHVADTCAGEDSGPWSMGVLAEQLSELSNVIPDPPPGFKGTSGGCLLKCRMVANSKG